MLQLSKTNLLNVNADIEIPNYLDESIGSGIVHFGIGNFHRAHQAAYCDILLNRGQHSWGITAVSMHSQTMQNNLAPQDHLYTLATLNNQNGIQSESFRVIGAIVDILFAPTQATKIISAIANKDTHLVTTTITEKGYYLDNNSVDLNAKPIRADLSSLEHPQSTYGFIAKGLIQRQKIQGSNLTVLCCDNIHGGGSRLQQGVLLMLTQHSPETLDWVARHVSFCSSMVDRVTPAVKNKQKHKIAQQVNFIDAAPVATEPFTQWIIEDNFVGKRPPFDAAGAVFVNDITPYEQVKLRFLNAGHSMLATLGYLAGDKFIHEALNRPTLAKFTQQALTLNVLPATSVPANIDANDYIEQVLVRFTNSSLPYEVLQVGQDSSQKIPQRWLPTIDDAIAQGSSFDYLAFALASWVSFVIKATANSDLNDPLREPFSNRKSVGTASHVRGFLGLVGADKFRFFSHMSFMKKVENYHQFIEEQGVINAIETSSILESSQ